MGKDSTPLQVVTTSGSSILSEMKKTELSYRVPNEKTKHFASRKICTHPKIFKPRVSRPLDSRVQDHSNRSHVFFFDKKTWIFFYFASMFISWRISDFRFFTHLEQDWFFRHVWKQMGCWPHTSLGEVQPVVEIILKFTFCFVFVEKTSCFPLGNFSKFHNSQHEPRNITQIIKNFQTQYNSTTERAWGGADPEG